MYTDRNYKTKKDFLADLKAGKTISVFQPGPFGGATNGKVCIEGPHYPQPHKWYASAVIVDGIVKSAK